MSTARTIHSLADAIDRARPEVTETDRHVVAVLYRLLGRGRPVAPAELAAVTERSQSDIETRLARWPATFRDQQGRVIGFWGLSVRKMPPHEVSLDGRKLWAWCAWDALFLPRRLGTLDVRSRDPITGQEIKLRVGPEGVSLAEPAAIAVSILEPRRVFDADVISSFCHYVHFFVDAKAGEKWTCQHPGTFLISLEDAFELGRLADESLLGRSQTES